MSMLAECDCVLRAQTKHLGRLPVVNFAAGGVATPADAALMMQMGMDGVFVGSGIFKAGNPSKRAKAMCRCAEAARLYMDINNLLLCLSRSLHYAEYCLYSQGGCSGLNRAVSTCLCI